MRKISFWAKQHKVAARILIVSSFILLNVIGIFTGQLFSDLGVTMSIALMLSASALFCLAWIFYPAKDQQNKKLTASGFYIYRKTCDIILAACTFIMLVYIGNKGVSVFTVNTPLYGAIKSNFIIPRDSTVKKYKSISSFYASMKGSDGKLLKWKERRKLLTAQIHAIKHSDEGQAGRIALIVLSVIVAIGLIGLVASAACSISCNGSDGAAILVAVGGTALIIFLLIVAIRAINKKNRQRKREEKKHGEF